MARPTLDGAAGMKRRHALRAIHQPAHPFAGLRFPPTVILLAVQWYLRCGVSYRDLDELLAQQGYRGRARDLGPLGAEVYLSCTMTVTSTSSRM